MKEKIKTILDRYFFEAEYTPDMAARDLMDLFESPPPTQIPIMAGEK